MQPKALVETHHHSIEMAARLGFISRGITYATIALLALQVAFHQGGRLTDSKGALSTLAAQPFGQILLIAMGIGFVGYGAWQTLQTVYLPEESESEGAKRAFKRLSHAFKALLHFGLAGAVLRQVVLAQSGGGTSAQAWTARLMSQPFGVWLVGAVGLGIIVFGAREGYKAWQGRFQEHLDLPAGRSGRWICRLAKWGLTARSVIFMLAGGFVVQAALRHDPGETRSLGGTLNTIASQPYGKILLGLVAAGLLAYALYMACASRYYRVRTVH
ncbi:MAG: DUF1206 domain-containing protein [Candidatus Sericytochromatia bacterium]